MNSTLTQDFLENFDEVEFPHLISSRFNTEHKINKNNASFCETYLICEKLNQKLFILKRYKKNNEYRFNKNESEILNMISHSGLPKYLPELDIETETFQYSVREYIEGVTLEKYQKDDKIDEAKAVEITIKICDILTCLHNQAEPVIHRDIKPTNIIINPKTGAVYLIDFGISRKLKENAEMDTICFGTRNFAPPEQYGFSQTDHRADIFALGIVLRYMLTGSYEANKLIKNKSLEKIAAKCSQLDRDKRYSCAAEVKNALLKYDAPVYLTNLEKIKIFASLNENNLNIFKGLGWDLEDRRTWAKIEWRRLDDKITKIYFQGLGLTGDLDLSGFSALDALHLGSNNLTSLNLSGCASIEYLDCGGNRIKELDVSDLKKLKKFWCWGNELHTIDLTNNPVLEYLNINANYIKTLDLSNNPALTHLDIWKNLFETMPAIENHKNLFYVRLRENYIDLDNENVKVSLAKIEETTNANRLVLPPDWKKQATENPQVWEVLFNHWYDPNHTEHWWDWNSMTGGLTAEPQFKM